LLNAAGAYPTFMSLLDAAEPMTISPSNGPDVKVVAVTDDPDGHRFS
jgi:hypothetical protein